MFDPKKPPSTLAEMAHRSFVAHADRPFLCSKAKGAIEYEYASYAQVAARVRYLAGGLLKIGIARGDRVAILSENRIEWAITDLACQMIGAISVPLFSTLPSNQVHVILEDSGASLVLVSNASQVKKIEQIRDRLPALKYVVICDGEAEGALGFSQLERDGEEYFAARPGEYETTWPAAMPDDVATIIYTSGTSGVPKGVMLCHRNIIANLECIIFSIHLSSEDVFLSFLPLAHVYERTAGHFLPTRLGARIAYCESLFTVDKNLREVQPTIMFCVPRLYESMREKLFSVADNMPANQKAKYLDALALAQKAGTVRGKLPDATPLSLIEKIKYKIYDAKVYSKIRIRFGGRLRYFVAGGAPLPPQLGALFHGLGASILEGYGLTETSPVIAVNRPEEIRLGTVGRVLSNVEVKIESDGEICVRGNSIMKGYWNKPDATAECLTPDGWFHTGDIGELNGGILKITDRKKDLLVLANGKKVAPAPIEMKLTQSPYIAQAVLLGDKMKAVSALIVPRFEAVAKWQHEQSNDSDNKEQDHQAALLNSPQVLALFKDEIKKYSDGLADFEKIKKWALLSSPFSVENGELTPTLKVKRRVVAEKYSSLLGNEE
jgi:long-chain acyl-CoA synthetase